MTPPAQRLRAAVIGYGMSGRRIHIPLLQSVPEMELAAIIVRSEASQHMAANEHPGVAVFPDVTAMLRAGVRPDIAVVATPDSSHAALSADLLRLGIGVVVDKPLATAAAEAEQLHQNALEKGLLYTCFQNRRWDSDFLTVARLVREGRLGQVTRFESAISKWIPAVGSTWRDQAADSALDGGLAGLGSHLVDQAVSLFGCVESVYAEVDTRRPGARANDDAFVALTHGSGVRTHLWMSAHTSTAVPRFRVQGTAGSFLKDGFDVQQEALMSQVSLHSDSWGKEPTARQGILTVDGNEMRIPTERGNWKIFYSRLAKTLFDGSPLPVLPEDVIHCLHVLEAAVESHIHRSSVTVPATLARAGIPALAARPGPLNAR
ncbi:Gfo/Idh/MocA family oxidoreductase [Arthrobacter sp. NPDC058097]|uniref:Gfo/Idh/MocA family protein n=1 Tax=Arthrobacter sp. NPDC058097 TaxID=3346340 RepID=UPI0036DD81FD